MISLQTTEGGVKFVFTNSDHYLYGNGTIEVPLNSLALVTDKSDMFTFKKAATNDPFISAKYSDIGMTKEELETFYNENMVGGNSVDPEEVQALIDASISGNVKSVTSYSIHSTSGDSIGLLVRKVDGSSAYTNVFTTRNGSHLRCTGNLDELHLEESFVSGIVTSAIYDSSGKTIELKNESGVTVSTIDATDFIKDGMVNNVEVKDVEISGETVPCLAITFNTDAGHQEIDIPLSEFFDSTQYYTKSETDSLLSGKTDESAFTEFSASTEAVLSGKVDTSAITSSLTYDSTDSEVPSARIVHEELEKKQDVLSFIDPRLLVDARDKLVIDDFTNGTTASMAALYNGCLLIKTNPNFSEEFGDLNISIEADEINDGHITFFYDGFEMGFSCNFELFYKDGKEYFKNLMIPSREFNFGDTLLIDLRDLTNDYSLANTIHFTVENYLDEPLLSSLEIYGEVDQAVVSFDEWKKNVDDNMTDWDEKEEVISRTFYQINDEISGLTNALSGKQDTLIAGSGISISGNVISANGGGGGSITIDPSLDSGSTNAVANSAITEAINSKANKDSAFGSYEFGENDGQPYLRYRNVAGSYIINVNEIYYPRINNKGILTTNKTWAVNNLNFSLVETSAITSSITSASTDTEIPSAKAVYDAIGEGGGGLDEDFLQANANALYELKQEGKATNERFDNYYTKTASDGRYASNASIKKAYYDKAYVDDKLLAISASLNELNDRIAALETQINNN